LVETFANVAAPVFFNTTSLDWLVVPDKDVVNVNNIMMNTGTNKSINGEMFDNRFIIVSF